jgi:osmoprotectant transport system ATP-binding protein
MSPAIEFRQLSFVLPDGRVLLRDLSFAVEENTTTVLLGRSGSGKTTLLRTVNRMVAPSSGDVILHGRSIRDQDLLSLRRGIGYVIQETGLFPHFRIERDVGLVLEAESRPKEERNRRSHELLAAVGLDPVSYARRYPHQLSGGQRQRVGLARALAADPSVLLMDEPFGALDPLTRAEMQDMVRTLLSQFRKTVLLVTHDLDEALYLGDRIALLSEGGLVAYLAPQDFLRCGDPRVQAYIRAFHRGEHAAESPRPEARA